MNGLKDEDFLVDLSYKVHRGMKGAVLEGHHTGGPRYGYKSILVEDPSERTNTADLKSLTQIW